MTQIIKPDSVDFNALIKSSTVLTLHGQSKMIETLTKEFNEEEAQWYIANLYVYMNYHPTNDFPINLDTLVKLVGFAHKKNAKRTLENNFIKDEDYKITVLPREHGKFSEEIVMLNIDTFKNMCMLVKTEKSKTIRKYYVKLENIYNKIIKEEIEQQKVLLENNKELLENNKKELQQTQQQLKKEKIHKNQILRRKYYDMKQGDAIYLYKDDENNERSLLKIGKSKNISEREKVYSNMSKNGSIIYVKRCLNCDLTESLLHHLLDKYRINSMQEWFELPSEEFGKQIIDTIINLIDSQIENIYIFIPTLQNFINTNNTNINNNIEMSN
jgi:phage anti-repressor protein